MPTPSSGIRIGCGKTISFKRLYISQFTDDLNTRNHSHETEISRLKVSLTFFFLSGPQVSLKFKAI